jgi:hypothetical protein
MSLEDRVAALEARVAWLEGDWPGFLKDCRLDMFRHGQAATRVRLTHLPTGVVVDAPSRDEATWQMGAELIWRGDITINDARAAHGLPPFEFAGVVEAPAKADKT